MGQAKLKKFKNIVNEYASKNGVSIEIATRRVRAFDIALIKYRRAKKCPKCGKHELCIDSTDYEFTSNESWVYCSECGFTSDIHKKYEPLMAFYAFDIVAAMSDARECEFGVGWEEFALKDTTELEQELGIYGNSN